MSTLEQNKEIVQRIFDEFWLAGKTSVLDQLLATDVTNHRAIEGAGLRPRRVQGMGDRLSAGDGNGIPGYADRPGRTRRRG